MNATGPILCVCGKKVARSLATCPYCKRPMQEARDSVAGMAVGPHSASVPGMHVPLENEATRPSHVASPASSPYGLPNAPPSGEQPAPYLPALPPPNTGGKVMVGAGAATVIVAVMAVGFFLGVREGCKGDSSSASSSTNSGGTQVFVINATGLDGLRVTVDGKEVLSDLPSVLSERAGPPPSVKVEPGVRTIEARDATGSVIHTESATIVDSGSYLFAPKRSDGVCYSVQTAQYGEGLYGVMGPERKLDPSESLWKLDETIEIWFAEPPRSISVPKGTRSAQRIALRQRACSEVRPASATPPSPTFRPEAPPRYTQPPKIPNYVSTTEKPTPPVGTTKRRNSRE